MAHLQRPLRPIRAIGRLPLAAAAVLALALAGCGTGSKSEAPRPAPVTTVASVPKPAKPVSRRVVVETKQRLTASKLQASDLGLGWTPTMPKMTSSGPQHFCNRDLAGLKPYARTDAVFERHNGGGIVAQSMSAYPDGQAQRLLASLRDLLGSCNGWTRNLNGLDTTYTLAPLEFPSVGDEAIAARLDTSFTFKQRPVTVTSDFVMMRQGNVVTFLSRTAPVGQQPSAQALAALAQVADRKLAAT